MKRILLIDDEPHVLAALKRVLRPHFNGEALVETFDNAEAALDRLREFAADVVVSDYRMPKMNGVEFLRIARQIQPHAVRMILSASYEFDTILQAVNEVEIHRYIAKPWSDDDMVAHVRSALNRAEQSRVERRLADAMRMQSGDLSAEENERRRLEEQEPGITTVEWGPQGEVLMPEGLIDSQLVAH